MTTRTVGALVALVVVVAGCSRGSDVGSDEAIEILVLDGLERAEAECLVAQVSGELELAEVIGVSGDLDAAELEVLFRASRSCQPTSVPGSGAVVGGSLDELTELEGVGPAGDIDVEGVVAELLRGGLEPEVAVCVTSMLLGEDDPMVAISDEARKVEAIVACEPD